MKKRVHSNNIKRFIQILDEKGNNIFPPATEAQLVVDCLCDLFLGPDWHCVGPMHTGQVNTVILDNILAKYLKGYVRRKERL